MMKNKTIDVKALTASLDEGMKPEKALKLVGLKRIDDIAEFLKYLNENNKELLLRLMK